MATTTEMNEGFFLNRSERLPQKADAKMKAFCISFKDESPGTS